MLRGSAQARAQVRLLALRPKDATHRLPYILDNQGRLAIEFRFPEYEQVLAASQQMPRYRQLWRQRKVYSEEVSPSDGSGSGPPT